MSFSTQRSPLKPSLRLTVGQNCRECRASNRLKQTARLRCHLERGAGSGIFARTRCTVVETTCLQAVEQTTVMLDTALHDRQKPFCWWPWRRSASGLPGYEQNCSHLQAAMLPCCIDACMLETRCLESSQPTTCQRLHGHRQSFRQRA